VLKRFWLKCEVHRSKVVYSGRSFQIGVNPTHSGVRDEENSLGCLFAAGEHMFQYLSSGTKFRGKTMRIVVGFSAGGGFDAYARAIARHWGSHLPGNPTTIVDNMPGAGSLIAANHIYNQAKPDGLTIGHFIGGGVVGQLLGNPAAKFDSQKFEWVGAPAKLDAVCAVTKQTGVSDLHAWRNAKVPLKLGATGPGSETYDVPRVLQAALGLPMQIISGYKGTADIRLAAENGEIGGLCWGWEVMKAQWRCPGFDSSRAETAARFAKGTRGGGIGTERRSKAIDPNWDSRPERNPSPFRFAAQHAARNCQSHAASISGDDEGFPILSRNEASKASRGPGRRDRN
jgi:hypothetical protein